METLDFKPRIRQGGAHSHTVHYWDFVISGKSLFELLALERFDVAGIFSDTVSSRQQNAWMRQLTGQVPGDLAPDRYPLYVCPECADFACGVVSVEIVFESDCVIWQNFTYENTIDPPDNSCFEYWVFTFAQPQYQNALSLFRHG
ncbi:hypothetical protein L1281_001429 [Neisseria sp. HSC-16F19]|nr:hypothetical protein [Neisseria sp. HSC-16F19]MCP2040839.1 hypothetical protein [Neisseria sp. HSC-16F19]